MKKLIIILCLCLFAQQNDSLLQQANALKESCDKDYESFVDAFPSTYTNFLDLFGFDYNTGGHVLYDNSSRYISFFFSDKRVLEHKNLDKILGISYGFRWDADAPNYLIHHTLELSTKYPEEIISFLNEKPEDDRISFFKLCLTCLYPDHPYYLKDYHSLLQLYESYSSEYGELIKKAFKLAAEDSKTLVIG